MWSSGIHFATEKIQKKSGSKSHGKENHETLSFVFLSFNWKFIQSFWSLFPISHILPDPPHLPTQSPPWSLSLENKQAKRRKREKEKAQETQREWHDTYMHTHRNRKLEIITHKLKTSLIFLNSKTKQYETKNKNTEEVFLLTIYCWTWSLPLHVVRRKLIFP